MTNLTAAQYKSEMDQALAQYEACSSTQLERGDAWSQIAANYCQLFVHQKMFDNKRIVPSAAALVYRTKAETLLARAKAKIAVQLLQNIPASVSASHTAGVAAYTYVQLVKIEAALAAGS